MKKRVITSLTLTFSLLIPIALINYLMDPMWVFNHTHKYNNYQEAPNERQQKSNKLYFTDKKYDTLLLGSSRSTYMNQEKWQDHTVFNFSVGDLYPNEYRYLIDFSIHDSKQPIKTVIIGADFFTYFFSSNTQETRNAIKTSKSPFYRYKLLLSTDATRLSIKNIRNYFMSSKHVNIYSRSNIKLLSKRPNHTERLPDMITRDLKLFKAYKYIPRGKNLFLQTLLELKERYPNINFIVYTTPISLPLFNMMVKNGHYNTYEQWLYELTSVFGNVYHFMYKNVITINYPIYFDDAHHTFSSTQDIIVEAITGKEANNKRQDFGMLLNRENINQKIALLRIQNDIATIKD